MKKTALIILGLVAVFLAAVYLLIPSRVNISVSKNLPVNKQALYRNLADQKKWANWWPGEKTGDSSSLVYQLNGFNYQLHDIKVLSLPVNIKGNGLMYQAEFLFFPINPDTSKIEVIGSIPMPMNPISRIKAFLSAKKLRKDIDGLFNAMGTYYSVTTNAYGYDIQNQRVKDSILLMNFKEMKSKPGTGDIYALVDELKAYIKSQGAIETGNPMLNIFTRDSVDYLLKVAIPTNKKLPDSGNMSYRWMLGGGNILITEVKGGPDEIAKAHKQIQLFIMDYNRVAPAIPFESLVTDRRSEPDSTRWVTRIYYPVM